ncbi:hypothetical protein [Alteraurantiacibacter buctensis]|uniref:Transferrin-binding protein B C-lobe/N-lobe beta barrel domain-containing protein n=1 Tax=Alteraurantiacibacter buctensis TaxID=1503981 RepID=A0A844Z5H8_9SPHN|nr:hypothetical protein [Alteraurantiacibacter buctensis]MXO73073.1 hypothetical protein [Alteraurantiacibacter buctensis]
MLRKFDLVLSAAMCCAVLTSCGGGNPTPTPTGTGTPTPTPTTTATPVVYNFTSDFIVSSGGIYIYANFTPTGGAEVFSDASRLTGVAGLAYTASPEKVVFGFPDLTDDVTYLGSERTSATATSRVYVRDDTSLSIDKPFTHTLRATYKRTDPFTRSGVAGTLRGYRVGLFTLPVTVTTAIGSNLTFSGTPQVVGGTSGTTPAGAVSSTASTFTVVPAASATASPTITGSVAVFDTISGTTTQRANLAFTGTINASGGITGTIADTPNAFTGAFSGALSGANRDEVAIVFSATHADGRKYVGSVIAD